MWAMSWVINEAMTVTAISSGKLWRTGKYAKICTELMLTLHVLGSFSITDNLRVTVTAQSSPVTVYRPPSSAQTDKFQVSIFTFMAKSALVFDRMCQGRG